MRRIQGRCQWLRTRCSSSSTTQTPSSRLSHSQLLGAPADGLCRWYKVKVKPKTQDEESPIGLVPANYVERVRHYPARARICTDYRPQANPIWIAKALYGYEAAADDELTVTEDEALLVYDKEEDWTLVKSQTGMGIGFVPTAYIGEVSAAHARGQASADHPQGEDAEDEPPMAEPARIVVPSSVSECQSLPSSTATS